MNRFIFKAYSIWEDFSKILWSIRQIFCHKEPNECTRGWKIYLVGQRTRLKLNFGQKEFLYNFWKKNGFSFCFYWKRNQANFQSALWTWNKNFPPIHRYQNWAIPFTTCKFKLLEKISRHIIRKRLKSYSYCEQCKLFFSTFDDANNLLY